MSDVVKKNMFIDITFIVYVIYLLDIRCGQKIVSIHILFVVLLEILLKFCMQCQIWSENHIRWYLTRCLRYIFLKFYMRRLMWLKKFNPVIFHLLLYAIYSLNSVCDFRCCEKILSFNISFIVDQTYSLNFACIVRCG